MTHGEADKEVRWHAARAGRAFEAARLLIAECERWKACAPTAVYLSGNDQEVAMRWGTGHRRVIFIADANGHYYVRIARPVGALHFKTAPEAVAWLMARLGAEGKADGN